MDDAEVIEISSTSSGGVAVYTISIPGTPAAMPRPEFMTWNGINGKLFRRVVNGAKPAQKKFKKQLVTQMQNNYYLPEGPVYPDGPVAVSIVFHRPVPKSWFVGADRSRPLKTKYEREILRADTHKPDIDNLAKFVLDVMNAAVYADDKQVTRLVVTKVYDDMPPFEGRTVIRFKKWDRSMLMDF